MPLRASAGASFLWIAFRRARGVSFFWNAFAGASPRTRFETALPSTLASVIAGRLSARSRFRGSGREVERAGRGVIWLRSACRHGIEQVFEACQRAMYACDRARRQLAEARIVQHALQRLQKLLCMLLANLPLRLGGGRCRDAFGRRRVEMLFRDLRLARVLRFQQARDDPLQRPFRAVPSYLLDHERAGDGAVADELVNLRRCLLEQPLAIISAVRCDTHC